MLYTTMLNKIKRDTTLSGSSLYVLLLLHGLSGKEDYIYTTQAQLAEHSPYHKSNISRALKILENKGYISRDGKKITVRESVYPKGSKLFGKDKGFLNISIPAIKKLLDKKKIKKIKKSGLIIRLAIYLIQCLSAEMTRKKFNNDDLRSYKIISNLSIRFRCSKRYIQKALKTLETLGIIQYRYDRGNKIGFIKADKKDLKPLSGERANDLRNTYIIKTLTRRKLLKKKVDEKDYEETGRLITQYPKHQDLLQKAILSYVRENNDLNARAIHNLFNRWKSKIVIGKKEEPLPPLPFNPINN